MQKQVEVLIIGAGTAGLAAVKEVKLTTQNYLLVDHGPLGTTCARVGCMPSKALIQIAQACHRTRRLQEAGILAGDSTIQLSAIFTRVRKLRDDFVSGLVDEIRSMGEHFVQGHARFTGPNSMVIDDKLQVQAKRIIIATGTKPLIPKEWPKHPGILTSDSFFELEQIPQRWAIAGLGPIGLEIGQALAFLGLDVSGFDLIPNIGGLKDPHLNQLACEAVRTHMPLNFGTEIQVKEDKGQLKISFGDSFQSVDAILASIGRQADLKSLELDKTDCTFDPDGFPVIDRKTQFLQGTSILFAGDVDRTQPILHEAVDDGRIAGFNATHEKPQEFIRRTPLAIIFTSPGIAAVGIPRDQIEDVLVGITSYENQGRAKIMGENKGALQLYMDRSTTRLLGAEIVAPEAEHLAHLLAWSIQSELTLHDMLRLPFYHPTIEEGLRTALQDAAKKLPQPTPELTSIKDQHYSASGSLQKSHR